MNTINICFASDDGYAEHLLVAIFSLRQNLNPQKSAKIFILDGGISAENQSKIEELQTPKCKIEFIKTSTEKYKNHKTGERITKSTFLRLDISEILQKESKVIYLDCDIIINGDISLIENSPNKKNFWAVKDIGAQHHYKQYRKLKSQRFFNAGVATLNLKELREKNAAQKMQELLKKEEQNLVLADQDIRNIFFDQEKEKLPLKFNALDRVFLWPRNRQFPREELLEARRNPVIIHFAGAKPRKKHCFHPLRKKYHDYRAQAWLPPVQFSKKTELTRLGKNLLRLGGVVLLNTLTPQIYKTLIFKPKTRLKNLKRK